jgi:hypothetical protein
VSRTTDEQIAEWRTWCEVCLCEIKCHCGSKAFNDALDALKAERDRADKAEKLADQRAIDYHIGNRLLYDHYARKEHRLHDEVSGRDHLIRVLWKSRRKWQYEAKKWHGFFLGYVRISERDEARLAKVRALHLNVTDKWDDEMCGHCDSDWPCRTVRIIGYDQ